jgi:hypothetical protein
MERVVLTTLGVTLADRRFWNMKIKIALLAAATFIALC